MGTINIVSALLALVGVGLRVLTLVVTAGMETIQLPATILIGGTTFVFGLLIGKALSGVAKTALHVYATESTAPEFSDDMDFSDVGGDKSPSSGSLGDRLDGSSGGGQI